MNKPFLYILSLLFALYGYASSVAHSAEVQREPTPVIVDTDMGSDDWMAILYLLQNPAVELKAITVDCVGETYCLPGAVNVTRLMEIAKRSQIPVFFGYEPAVTLNYQYPNMIRYYVSSMQAEGYNEIKGVPVYSGNAVAHLHHLIVDAGKAGKPLTLISIGSATNLAAAIEMAKAGGEFTNFQKGVKQIFKGGGSVGEVVKGRLTNRNIKGNINMPGLFPSDNSTAEWNIYPNASAAEILISSSLPVTLIPLNLSGDVPVTKASYKRLLDTAKSDVARFVVQVIADLVSYLGGWEKVDGGLYYWDPTVVVSAINPDLVSEKYVDVSLCVETADNSYHGTTYVDEGSKCERIGAKSGLVTVYTKIKSEAFLTEFFRVLNR